eukprot:jgi/Tetstr1/458408/TSEL_044844.t1
MATLRADDPTPPQARADADYLLDSALRTLKAVAAAVEDRLTYIMRFKGKTALTGDEKVAERLFYYHRFFDTSVANRGANGIDGLLAALDVDPAVLFSSPLQVFISSRPRPE